jgi:hypothetical protein
MMKKLKMKAALITLAIQLLLAAIFFVGTLLDPLLGVYIVLFYFVFISSILIYKITLNILLKS